MTPIAVITATTATMIHALPALNRSLSVMPILLSRGSLAMNRMAHISNRAIMMVTKVSMKNIEPMAASPASAAFVDAYAFGALAERRYRHEHIVECRYQHYSQRYTPMTKTSRRTLGSSSVILRIGMANISALLSSVGGA